MRIITALCADNSAKQCDKIQGCPVLKLMALLSPDGLNISVRKFLFTGVVEKRDICLAHAETVSNTLVELRHLRLSVSFVRSSSLPDTWCTKLTTDNIWYLMKPDLRARWNYSWWLAVAQTAVSVIRHSYALPAELPIAIVNCMEKKTWHTHKNTLVRVCQSCGLQRLGIAFSSWKRA